MSKAAVNEAYKFILQNEINTLPISRDDLVLIAKRNEWKLCSYNASAELRNLLKVNGINTDEYIKTKDAFAVMLENEYIVFYKDSLSLEQKVFVILHEFAHIALKHTCFGVLGKSPDQKTTDIQEAEADEFTRTVCAPLPVLYRCHIRSGKDIERYGLLNSAEANKQFISLSQQNVEYGLSDTEKAISDQFISFIQDVKFTRLRSVAKRYAPVGVIALLIGMLLMVPFLNNQTQPGSSQPAPVSNAVNTSSPNASLPQTDTVFVTRTGDKFHVEGCQHIKGKDDLQEMTPQQALERGLEPCSVCIK